MPTERFSVLVVDDHAPTRYALTRRLRKMGFNTVEAASGARALELAEYVSALLLDVNLPDLSGLEVCRLLRAKPSTASLPVIQMSAVCECEEQARAAGADAFMAAPLDEVRLTETLRHLLGDDPGATPR